MRERLSGWTVAGWQSFSTAGKSCVQSNRVKVLKGLQRTVTDCDTPGSHVGGRVTNPDDLERSQVLCAASCQDAFNKTQTEHWVCLKKHFLCPNSIRVRRFKTPPKASLNVTLALSARDHGNVAQPRLLRPHDPAL